MDQTADLIKKLSSLGKTREFDVVSFGDASVGSLVKHHIPLCLPTLNAILGGGIPCGRIIEVYGLEGNGKSSLGAEILAATQRLGGVALVIDSEKSFEPNRMEKMGVSKDKLVYTETNVIEDVFTIIDTALADATEKGHFLTIVWDSVAAGITQKEKEAAFGSSVVADRARLIYEGIRRINNKIGEKSCLILVNQVRSLIGNFYGKTTQSTGGHAIRFFSSVRIEMYMIGKLKVGEKEIGIRTRAYTAKNKVHRPYLSSEFEIKFAGGLDDTGFMLELLLKSKLVNMAGGWCEYKNRKFRKADFKEFLEGLQPEERKMLLDAALGSIDGGFKGAAISDESHLSE